MKINLAILAPIFFLCCNASENKKGQKGFRYYMPKEKMSKNCEYVLPIIFCPFISEDYALITIVIIQYARKLR